MAAHKPLTVAEFFADAVRRFTRARLHFGHGTHNARDEAAYLILHALRLPIDSLEPHSDRRLSAAELHRLNALLEQRIRQRIPASYLTREAWLGEYSFYVDRRTIIPRSFIAELLREAMEPWVQKPVLRILDLCTGSGCLAVLAAMAFPKAHVDATDVSPAALAVARRNIRHYRLDKRVRAIQSDLFADLAPARYDLILCNPPYVDTDSMRHLPQEYRHEPVMALSGGADGLRIVRRILADAPRFLSSQGILVCETGHHRRRLERSHPDLPFVWLETSSGPDHVFLLEKWDRSALAGSPRSPGQRKNSPTGRPRPRRPG